MIEVKQTSDADPLEFEVTVSSENTSTRHQISVSNADCHGLAPGQSPDRLVRAAFLFLLDREPKESIMSRFDISVIGRYFPEFEQRIADYLK